MALRLAIIEDNADLLDELLAWLGYRGFEVWGTRSADCTAIRWISCWLISACPARMASAY